MKLKGKKPNPYKIAEEICNHHGLLFDDKLIKITNTNKFKMFISNDINLIIVIQPKRNNDLFYYYNTKTYDAKEHSIKTFSPIWNNHIIKYNNLKKLIDKI
jgi:hypothetical protein